MKRGQLRWFKELLENQKAVIRRRLTVIRGELSAERSPDAAEAACFHLNRELGFTNLNRDSDVLREIHSALDRIDDGTFGACTSCGDEIALKRLKAVPWSPLCINCQEAADRDDAARLELLREAHANAA